MPAGGEGPRGQVRLEDGLEQGEAEPGIAREQQGVRVDGARARGRPRRSPRARSGCRAPFAGLQPACPGMIVSKKACSAASSRPGRERGLRARHARGDRERGRDRRGEGERAAAGQQLAPGEVGGELVSDGAQGVRRRSTSPHDHGRTLPSRSREGKGIARFRGRRARSAGAGLSRRPVTAGDRRSLRRARSRFAASSRTSAPAPTSPTPAPTRSASSSTRRTRT